MSDLFRTVTFEIDVTDECDPEKVMERVMDFLLDDRDVVGAEATVPKSSSVEGRDA